MKALQDLSHEHDLIRRVIAVLEALNTDLTAGERDPAAEIKEAIRFVRGFADKCHHAKEEKFLFPLIASKNTTLANGPVRILTSEHDAGRMLIGEVERVPGLEVGDEEAKREAARALTLYTRMLRKHIDKEEDILFPLTQSIISTEEAGDLEEQFEAVEGEMGLDAHKKFIDIVESLEKRQYTAPRLNAAWHHANPMPRNPTLDQRIKWHVQHQEYCSCREIPGRVKAEMKKRGIEVLQ